MIDPPPSSGLSFRLVIIPLWFPLLLAAVPTVVMFRSDRRRRLRERSEACIHCGYSRVGLPADRACPECGKPVAA